MNKSNKISNKLRKLEEKAGMLFLELIDKGDFNFAKDQNIEDKDRDELEESGDVELLPAVEFRNSVNGNVEYLYVLSVHREGIFAIDSKIYKFEELSSLEDKLILLNEMEELK